MAGTLDIIGRGQWGARASRGASSVPNARGVKIHYTGGREDPRMVDDHALCLARVASIQADHMDRNKWNDIAYSLLVCIHGRVIMGRGPHILTAANGAGLNRNHYSVCALVGNAGLLAPDDDDHPLYAGLCDAIGYLVEHGDAGGEVLGHRDGYATDCPGDRLYQWVKDGAPCPDDEGDEMPQYVSLTTGKPQALKAGEWSTITWAKEWADKNHQHADAGGPSVLNGPALYALWAGLVIEGLPAGAEFKVRLVEVDADGKDEPKICPADDGVGSSGVTEKLFSAGDTVDEGRRVRVQVQPLRDDCVLAAGTSLKLQYSR